MLFRIIIFILCFATHANAYSLIRDAEIETTLQDYFQPIFDSAGVEPHIYIVNSPELNAFVAGGQNIFINTGLILKSDTPEMLIAVVAHETSHITGGHIITHKGEAKRAKAKAILGYLLGAIAVAGGQGDAGMAAITMGGAYAQADFAAYSRSTEQIADRAAIELLNRAKISSQGMVDTFEMLRREEKKHPDLTPYLRSHPVSTERIMNLRAYASDNFPKQANRRFERMKVKLAAFLGIPYTPKGHYPCLTGYANSIRLYRAGKIDESISLLDEVIGNYPYDPFLYELKGQILYENGRNDEAITAYQKAFNLLPHPLIRYGLGMAQVNSSDKIMATRGIVNIRSALAMDKGLGGAYYYLAKGYETLGEEGKKLLALAENERTLGNNDRSRAYATKALKHLKKGSPPYIRAKDLLIEEDDDD